MRIMLATLCLNEMEWLPCLYDQHKEWPELVNWTFVEAADKMYADTNPDRVNSQGLSVDKTSTYLQTLLSLDRRVTYIPHGFCTSRDPSQAKCQARDRYLRIADEVKPDYIIVIDADEFYSDSHQESLVECLESIKHSKYQAVLFNQRHIWYPPSMRHLPFGLNYEVVGAYWGVPHCRVWKWSPGLRYIDNHNYPQLGVQGKYLTRWLLRADASTRAVIRHRYKNLPLPQCVHLGFASTLSNRSAKHKYYEVRGESKSRKMYVDCRRAYEQWKVGDTLPHGARVIPYTGPIPEVFREYQPQDTDNPDKLQPAPFDATGYSSLERAIRESRHRSGG